MLPLLIMFGSFQSWWKEAESWRKLKEEAFPRLLDGKFDEEYQRELLLEFNEALGI